MAVDDDQNTCAVTEKGVNEHWRIQFNQTLTVKGMLLRLKGGKIYLYIYINLVNIKFNSLCLSLYALLKFYR